MGFFRQRLSTVLRLFVAAFASVALCAVRYIKYSFRILALFFKCGAALATGHAINLILHIVLVVCSYRDGDLS